MKRNYIIFVFTLILIMTSCVSKKKVLYFQDSTEQVKELQNFALKFKKDDLLTINVSSQDVEAVRAYNLPAVAYNLVSNSVTGVPKQQTYLIDSNGEIQFPSIGKIKLEGLTRVKAIELIQEKLKPFVNDAIVNIQIVNFKIDVLGDVSKPGTFQIQNERVSVLDALALAGDINISGERVIEVKRETPKGIVTGYIDLKLNASVYSSPYFFLQQNDVVYVRPNTAKMQSASYNQNTGLFISVASVLISLISILTR